MSLVDRVLDPLAVVPPDTRLLTATTKAGIDFFERRAQGETVDAEDLALASVTRYVARRMGLTDPGLNISAACASGTLAVGKAAALIAAGLADAVLVVCVDQVTAFALAGFSALKALSPDPCRPFDRHRRGLSLGEGAAALVLMSRQYARRYRRPFKGRILGWGAANDATHMTAPDRRGRGLIQAIRQALAVARRQPADIGAINAHGTGTIYNDQMELVAFGSLFGRRPKGVFSIKGAIGHCLGAAGGIETVIGLEALRRQTLPPTVGCADPEPAAALWVRPAVQPFDGHCLLSTNSGFGGVNSAVIIGDES